VGGVAGGALSDCDAVIYLSFPIHSALRADGRTDGRTDRQAGHIFSDRTKPLVYSVTTPLILEINCIYPSPPHPHPHPPSCRPPVPREERAQEKNPRVSQKALRCQTQPDNPIHPLPPPPFFRASPQSPPSSSSDLHRPSPHAPSCSSSAHRFKERDTVALTHTHTHTSTIRRAATPLHAIHTPRVLTLPQTPPSRLIAPPQPTSTQPEPSATATNIENLGVSRFDSPSPVAAAAGLWGGGGR